MNVKMEALEVDWKGNTYLDCRNFPLPVKEQFTQAIEGLRYGQIPLSNVKPLHGLGKGVYELTKNGKPAYRMVYVVDKSIIHILHVFVKSSSGTDKGVQELIKTRYKARNN